MDAPWWSCDHVYKIAPQLWGFSFQKWIKFVWLSDVSAWNAKRIRDYFSSNGFSDEVCQTILDQEIDGGSLLLLHRQDVISGLGLKLGPALKVFKQVKKLQTRRHFPSWTHDNSLRVMVKTRLFQKQAAQWWTFNLYIFPYKIWARFMLILVCHSVLKRCEL